MAEKPVYRLPLSLTSDGFYVASKKFQELALAHNFTGVDFVPLENGRFVLKVARKVAYDLDWVKQESWCPDCQNFRSNLTLSGSHPIADHEAPIGAFEVVESVERWGQEYGLHTAQHPDLIVGDGAGQVILAAKLPRVGLRIPGAVKRL